VEEVMISCCERVQVKIAQVGNNTSGRGLRRIPMAVQKVICLGLTENTRRW
jgi:hypothetical protein